MIFGTMFAVTNVVAAAMPSAVKALLAAGMPLTALLMIAGLRTASEAPPPARLPRQRRSSLSWRRLQQARQHLRWPQNLRQRLRSQSRD